MRKRTMTLGGALFALLLASVLLVAVASGGSAAQATIGGGVNVTPAGKTKPAEQGITVGRSYNNDVSRPASELAKLPAKQQPQREAAENATSAASSDFSPRVSLAVAANETSELAATV